MLTPTSHIASLHPQPLDKQPFPSSPCFFTLVREPVENGLPAIYRGKANACILRAALQEQGGWGVGDLASLEVLLQQQGHVGLAAGTPSSVGASLDQACWPFWKAPIPNH